MNPTRRGLGGGWVVPSFFILTCFTVALFLFSEPIFSYLSSRVVGAPVRLFGVRLSGAGDFFAERFVLTLPGQPPVTAQGVRTRGLCGYFFGGALLVRFESAESAMGRASGGLIWKAGRLVKVHARVALTPRGLSQVPSAWIRRLTQTSDGPGFFVEYADGRVVVRGRRGPILEAAWHPA